jgi:hypothetical protein
VPYVSRKLVRSMLAEMPEGLDRQTRSRWVEEIEADLASYDDRPLGGLTFAIRLRRRGGRQLAAELMLNQVLLNSKSKDQPENPLAPVQARLIKAQIFSGHQVLTYQVKSGPLIEQITHFEKLTEGLNKSYAPRDLEIIISSSPGTKEEG